MQMPEMMSSARLLALVAVEASEEPDAIARHPEVIEVIQELADRDDVGAIFERVIPGVVKEPASYLRSLASNLDRFRTEPLDDTPEAVENLALVAWVMEAAASLESVSEFAAVRPDEPRLTQIKNGWHCGSTALNLTVRGETKEDARRQFTKAAEKAAEIRSRPAPSHFANLS